MVYSRHGEWGLSFLWAGALPHHHLQMEGATGNPKACMAAWGMACFSGGNSPLGQAPSEISSRRGDLVFFNVCTNCFCHVMDVRCTFTWRQKL